MKFQSIKVFKYIADIVYIRRIYFGLSPVIRPAFPFRVYHKVYSTVPNVTHMISIYSYNIFIYYIRIYQLVDRLQSTRDMCSRYSC